MCIRIIFQSWMWAGCQVHSVQRVSKVCTCRTNKSTLHLLLHPAKHQPQVWWSSVALVPAMILYKPFDLRRARWDSLVVIVIYSISHIPIPIHMLLCVLNFHWESCKFTIYLQPECDQYIWWFLTVGCILQWLQHSSVDSEPQETLPTEKLHSAPTNPISSCRWSVINMNHNRLN